MLMRARYCFALPGVWRSVGPAQEEGNGAVFLLRHEGTGESVGEVGYGGVKQGFGSSRQLALCVSPLPTLLH